MSNISECGVNLVSRLEANKFSGQGIVRIAKRGSYIFLF